MEMIIHTAALMGNSKKKRKSKSEMEIERWREEACCLWEFVRLQWCDRTWLALKPCGRKANQEEGAGIHTHRHPEDVFPAVAFRTLEKNCSIFK